MLRKRKQETGQIDKKKNSYWGNIPDGRGRLFSCNLGP